MIALNKCKSPESSADADNAIVAKITLPKNMAHAIVLVGTVSDKELIFWNGPMDGKRLDACRSS
jgi:hypothetical protein